MKSFFNYKKFLIFFVLFGTFFLHSCGQSNIFSGLVDESEETSVENISNSIDYAQSDEDYKAVIDNIDNLIANSDLSSDDLKSAYILKGQAVLGRDNVKPTDLVTNVLNINENSTSDSKSEVYTSIEDLLSQNQVDSSSLKQSIESFDKALEIDSNLDKSTHVSRAVVNALYVVKEITDVFSVSENSITKKVDDSYKSVVKTLIDPDNNGDTSDGVLFYTNNFVESFNKGLSDDVDADFKSEMDRVDELSSNLNKINQSLNVPGESFSYNKNGQVFNLNSSSEDTDILDALTDVFNR